MAAAQNPGQGATPSAVALEYTRGTGPVYPTELFSSSAITPGLGAAVTTFNGTGGPVTLEAVADPQATGVTVTIAPKPNTPGTFDVTPTYAVPIVTSLPSAPVAGQLVFNSVTSNLALWNGAAWVTAHMT